MKKLIETRNQKLQEMDELLQKAKNEGRAFTEEEKEKTESIRTNIDSYVSGMLTDFCTGKADPADDKVWSNYLAKLEEMGLETYIDYVQTAYDRG